MRSKGISSFFQNIERFMQDLERERFGAIRFFGVLRGDFDLDFFLFRFNVFIIFYPFFDVGIRGGCPCDFVGKPSGCTKIFFLGEEDGRDLLADIVMVVERFGVVSGKLFRAA